MLGNKGSEAGKLFVSANNIGQHSLHPSLLAPS